VNRGKTEPFSNNLSAFSALKKHPIVFKHIPLAWLQLIEQKGRLAIAIAGIAFADMLIFVQLGFQDALYDSAVEPHRNLRADLVVINPQLQTLFSVKSFQRERLYQTLGYDGVASVAAIYIATGQWRNPTTRIDRAILVWGIEPTRPTFTFPEVNQKLAEIQSLNRVLFDRAGRPEYGDIEADYQKKGAFEVELNSKVVTVAGIFTNGASFAADGNVITSDSTFLTLFPTRKAADIEVGLIMLKPGTNRDLVQQKLATGMPDLRVLTLEEFAGVEKTYWESQGAIGFIFGLGVIVGFIVGIVIVYQILYTDVTDRLPEYATLKAMGYSDRYLFTIVLQEALILAILGFLPSMGISIGLYQFAKAATLLPIVMKLDRAIFVLVLTILMCIGSGAIAIRKLQAADPAELF
jgi:putative ABC transport system permease protein